MITPAISVLGAVEGWHIATPLLDPYVELIAIVILIGLFIFQFPAARPASGKCSGRSLFSGFSPSR